MKISKKLIKTMVTTIIVINTSLPALAKTELNVNNELKTNFANYQMKEEYDDKNDSEYNLYTEEYKHYLELSENDKENLEVIPRKYKVSFDDFISNIDDNKKEAKVYKKNKSVLAGNDVENTFPNSFDLRTQINIPVGNQGSYGLCWNFASIKTLETNLCLNNYGNYDFSELHLDYIESNEFGKYRKLHEGGTYDFFKDYVYYNNGPVLEEEVPYFSNYTINDYDYLLSLDKKAYVNKTIDFPSLYKYIDSNNNIIYSKNYLYEGTDGNLVYNEGDLLSIEDVNLYRNEIKNHIMKNGSLYCVIATPDYGRTYYNSTTNSEYCTTDELGNGREFHAISIIGWDDSYSKNNFNQDHKPENDGAYIALNSWGDTWGDNGIFYISYDDFNVETNLCGVVSATTNKEDIITKEIRFNDSNLYNAIKDEYYNSITAYNDEDLVLFINEYIIDEIKYLNLNNKGIKDLTGLEQFNNLQAIDLSNNEIDDISIFSNFKTLYYLNLEKNNISEINCDFSEIEIYSLNLGYNHLTNVECLKSVTSLSNLILNNNNITSIDFNNSKLEDLNANDNNITEISLLNNNLYRVELKNNNITDLSNIKNNSDQDVELYLSGNKNLNISTLDLNNITSLELNNCDLNELEFNESYNANILNKLSLENNNLGDLSSLPKKDYYYINLSYNANIDLSTIDVSSISYLILENCDINDEKIESISENIEFYSLDISNNPLSNLDFVYKYKLSVLDISNTNIKDLSVLGNINDENISMIRQLIASNNLELVGIENLIGINSLYLDNCGIENIEKIITLNNLESLSLNDNKINDASGIINLENLKNVSLKNNNIENIDFIKDISDNLELISLENNYISDLNPIKNLIDNNDRYLSVDLSGNKIDKYTDFSGKMCYIGYSNQNVVEKIDLKVNTENMIDFPEIIEYAFNERYKNNISFEAQNCDMDLQNKKIIINSTDLGAGEASIKINGGIFDGSIYTYKYNMKENINVIGIDTEYTGRTTYVEGEDFNIEDLKVFFVYENGITMETNDYNIENNTNLTPDIDLIRISYNDIEVFIDINVISKDDSRVVKFNEPLIFDYFITSGWDYESSLIYADSEKLELICLSDFCTDFDSEINIEEEISDLTGLSNFPNISSIVLKQYNSENIDELSRIQNISNIWINSVENPITDISLLNNLKNLKKVSLNNSKIKSVHDVFNDSIESIDINNIFDINDLEHIDNRVYLPEIYNQLLERCTDNVIIDVYYNTKNNNTLGEIKPIKDENGKYYVELDLEEYDEIIENREIEVKLVDYIGENKTISLFTEIDYSMEQFKDESEPIVLKDFGYSIKENKYVENVKNRTSIDEFKQIFNGENNLILEVFFDDNNIVEGNQYVRTGMKVKLKDSNNELLTDTENRPLIYTVVVKGDINGDGEAGDIDAMYLKAYRNEVQGYALNDEQIEAADINNDNMINYVDSNLLKLHRMEVEGYSLNYEP